MRILIIITVLVCLLKGTAFGSPDLPIIPSPQKVQKLTGNFDFNDSLILIPYREVGNFSFLRQLLKEFADLTVNDIADNRGVIELRKASDGKVQD
ncbi:MAG: glycoside hydrolase family 20 zincin-like fold domain-containing protein, partial [Saprospiraceae bacterium]|nr:glycoside hydrolase family 20 zincin-like fold domain-containing protein [Saprospiraceae bacterium]